MREVEGGLETSWLRAFDPPPPPEKPMKKGLKSPDICVKANVKVMLKPLTTLLFFLFNRAVTAIT